ncbi:MAG TPA: hypothetical protein VIL18_01140 [Longimicrobiales bacterium]
MIARLAYVDRTVRICHDHYSGALPLADDAPALGPVQDAREWWACVYCERERAAEQGSGGAVPHDHVHHGEA